MKKYLSLFLALTLLFSLAACGTDKPTGDDKDKDDIVHYVPGLDDDFTGDDDQPGDDVNDDSDDTGDEKVLITREKYNEYLDKFGDDLFDKIDTSNWVLVDSNGNEVTEPVCEECLELWSKYGFESWNATEDSVSLSREPVPCMKLKSFAADYENKGSLNLLFPDPEEIRADNGSHDLALSEHCKLNAREYAGDVHFAKYVENIDPHEQYLHFNTYSYYDVNGQNMRVMSNITFSIDYVPLYSSCPFEEYSEFLMNHVNGSYVGSRNIGGADCFGTHFFYNGAVAGSSSDYFQNIDSDWMESSNVAVLCLLLDDQYAPSSDSPLEYRYVLTIRIDSWLSEHLGQYLGKDGVDVTDAEKEEMRGKMEEFLLDANKFLFSIYGLNEYYMSMQQSAAVSAPAV